MRKFALFFLFATFFFPVYADRDACLRPLAEQLADFVLSSETGASFDNEFFIGYFHKHIADCKDWLAQRGASENFKFDEGGLEVDMDFYTIKDGVAGMLMQEDTRHALFMCENNRGLHYTIEGVGWGLTIAGAVVTFGVGAPAAKAAITAGKAGVAGAGKQGAKMTIKTFFYMGAEKVAGVAAGSGFSRLAGPAGAQLAIKGTLGVVLTWLKIAGKVAVTPALMRIMLAGKSGLAEAGRVGLSLVDSSFAFKNGAGGEEEVGMLPCIYVNQFSNCYLDCEASLDKRQEAGDKNTADDMNAKVFIDVYGKPLCADKKDGFILHELNANGSVGPIAYIRDKNKWEEMRRVIVRNVKNKGRCSMSFNDMDIYVGKPIYEVNTLEILGPASMVFDGIRLNDKK